jgi:hypothetical protein
MVPPWGLNPTGDAITLNPLMGKFTLRSCGAEIIRYWQQQAESNATRVRGVGVFM